ncbi:MAG TPA: hypothetical protein VFV99_01250 [Kofleriaceae bacterium]|nr:hypothetical protein [Kofleriaceae bacterium]
MTEVAPSDLMAVIGGADPSFGRCGPGSSWKILGDVRTPECAAHDQAVQTAIQNGHSYLGAQLQALPKLGPAIGSYFRERFKGSGSAG